LEPPDIEVLLALCDPEGEYVNSPSAIEPGTRRGRDEIAAAMRAQWESLTDGRWEIDRIYDRGEEVIALGRISRRMPGSDARLEGHSLVSYKIRSEKLVRIEVIAFGGDEVHAALEAAGQPVTGQVRSSRERAIPNWKSSNRPCLAPGSAAE
jgi:ketosteroid isomerase-like protein